MKLLHLLFFKHAFVLDGDDLDEVFDVTMPVVEHTACEGRARVQVVLTDQFKQLLTTDTILDQREFHHIHITEVVERVVRVIDVCHATTHTSREVSSCLTQHDNASTSHILTAMVAGALDDCDGT